MFASRHSIVTQFTALIAFLAVSLGADLRAAAQDAKRVALIIGNTKYQNMRELPNAVRDLDALAKLFEANGWKVMRGENLLHSAFSDLLADFSQAADSAEEVVVYYSGHGLELEGRNFLAPVDADIRDCNMRQQSSRRLIPLNDLLDRVTSRPKGVILFDACRNDPLPKCPKRGDGDGTSFSRAAVPKSFAKPDHRTMIGFSTTLGATASDGPAGEMSPYAKSFHARLSGSPKTTIDRILDQVRSDVISTTSQSPELLLLGNPVICLAADGCDQGPPREFKANLDDARRAIQSGDFDTARRNLLPLAEKGDPAAMRELIGFYDDLRPDHGQMLDWIEKAAKAGDKRAQLDFAWAHANASYFADLPQRWLNRLTKPQGAKLAGELLSAGEQEAALIIDTIDNDASPEPRNNRALEAAAQRSYPPARLLLLDQSLLKDTDEKPLPKAEVERIVAGLAQLARDGHTPALYTLLHNDTLTTARTRFGSGLVLTDAEIFSLLRQVVHPTSNRESVFGSMRQGAQLEINAEDSSVLQRDVAERLLTGRGTTRNPAEALVRIDAAIAYRRLRQCERGGGGCDMSKEFFLKGEILEALSQTDRSLALYLGTSEEYDGRHLYRNPLRAGRLLDRLGWKGAGMPDVIKAWNEQCATAFAYEAECVAATPFLVRSRDVALLAALHKSVREHLEPKDGTPPEGEGLAEGLAMLGLLGEASPGLLKPQETSAALMARAATLGSKLALEWYKQKGQPAPKQAEKRESKDIATHGNWRAQRQLTGTTLVQCHILTATAGAAEPAPDERKPTLWVYANRPNWGTGTLFYRPAVPGVQAGSIRVFLGATQLPVDAAFEREAIVFRGDQAQLVQRLARAPYVRIEFTATGLKGGDKRISDIHHLAGFAAAYKEMVGACREMRSALLP